MSKSNSSAASDYVEEVTNLCIIAEEPGRARAFIEAKVPPQEVARSLAALRASRSPEAQGWDRAIAAVNAKVGQW